MATQVIRFKELPGKTLTLDVFTLASDTAVQSALTCTEATNRKGLYVSQSFTDTLDGRHYIVKKESGTAIGSELVTLANASATYDADSVSPAAAVVAATKADPALGTAGLLRHAAKGAIPIGQGTSFNIQGRANLAVYGDSIAAGQLATAEANRWANIVATSQGMSLLSYAAGGRGVWSQASSAQSLSLLDKPAAIWMTGLNDIRRGVSQARTRRKIEACIYSMLLSAFSGTVTGGFSMTKTGTWYEYGAAGVGGRSSSGAYADTAGPILSGTFTGTSFGIGFVVSDGVAETFGSAIVRIDGEEVDRIYLNNWMDGISDSVNANTRGPLGRLYCGFANGPHLIEIEAAGNQIVPVDYVCPLLPPHLCVPVLLCDIPYLTTTGYTQDPWYANSELIDIVNQMQREIAAKVSSLGFPVGIAETNRYYDLSVGVAGDDIHPNNIGHAAIARGVLESIKYTEGYELPQLSLGLRERVSTAAAASTATQDSINADQLPVEISGVWYVRTTKRGTATLVIPDKTLKQPDGSDVTDIETQFVAGFTE